MVATELLIKMTDNPHLNITTRYHKWDIVEIQEEGFAWGTGMKSLGVLKILDLDPSKARKYMSSEYEADGETMKNRRIWQLLIDSAPDAIKQEFIANKEYTVTLAKVKNFIRDKRTGVIDTDL